MNKVQKRIISIILCISIFVFVISNLAGKGTMNSITANTSKYLENSLLFSSKEIKEVTFETYGYKDNNSGDYKITKKAEWTGLTTGKIDFEVDTNTLTNNNKKDVILVLDSSGSMDGEKYERLARDASELIEKTVVDPENTISIITFSDEAEILKTFSNNKKELIDIINSLEMIGGTNYSLALTAVDEVLSNYKFKNRRDCVVVFLTDGFPTVDNKNQLAQYEILTSKYPYIIINGIQYEMGIDITNELKEITHKQYNVDMELLRNVLFEAALQPTKYEKYELVDYIDNSNFYVESVEDIHPSIGTVKLEEENGKQKITWNITANDFYSGAKAQLTINIKLKEQHHDKVGYYSTNTKVDVKSIIDNEKKDLTSDITPVLKRGYNVLYDMNTPNGCTLENIEGGTYYAYDTVELSSEKPYCNGYTFTGWQTEQKIEYINSDYFVMPTNNITFKAVWSKFDISKSMNGEVYKVLTLYDTIKNKAVLDNISSDFVASQTGIDFNKTSSTTNGKGIYTIASTSSNEYPIHYFRGDVDNNNVIFAGYCWKIIRTTETGGVKIIYNGVPSATNTCDNTGTATQLTTKGFNTTQLTPGHSGYMYNKSYTYKNTNYKNETASTLLTSTSIGTNNYQYAKTVSYNEETSTYTLENPQQMTWADNYNNMTGYYTCLSETETSCTDLKYIVTTNSSTAYTISLTNNQNLDEATSIVISDSINDNGDGTYTLSNPSTIKLSDWYEEYINYKGHYICSDHKSTSCSSLRFITTIANNSYKYLTPSQNFVYGNTFTYENGTYTLKDTKTLWELVNTDTDLSRYHYTCLSTTNTCTTVNYIYLIESNNMYYYQLQNGEGIEDVLNNLLYADNVNKTNSTIKAYIDSWYGSNMTTYTKYLENTIFCNDRTITDLAGWDPNGKASVINNYLIFDAYYRVISGKPTLECKLQTDQFTLSKDNGGVEGYGNNALKYPVGLITSDEATYAGGTTSSNNNYYLYTGQYYWPMTPYRFRDYRTSNFIIYDNGSINGGYAKGNFGVRPVVSLKKGTIYDRGNGSKEKPFVILIDAE